jgi:hypothetical protein
MKRVATFTLIWLSAGGLVGCGQKPPPVIEAKAIEQPKAEEFEFKPPPKPETSDPAAKKLLDEMLAAHTGNKPEKLAALKECSFTRKGTADTPGGRVTAVWKRDILWPDCYRIRLETNYATGTKMTQSYALRGDKAWFQPGDDTTAKKVELAAGLTPALKGQFHEDCVTLLFVLADPKAVVAKGPTETLGDKELATVDVWTPAGQHARLGIDTKTKLLAKVVYVGHEADPQTNSSYPVAKELTFQEYKEFAGVKLGSKMFAQTRAKALGEWTELTVETTKPDAKVFDGP